MNAQVALRDVAAAAAYFVYLRVGLLFVGRMGDTLDARSDGAAIRLGADALYLDPVVVEFRIAADELRRSVDGVDDEIDVAIVVEIAEGATAGRIRDRDSRAAILRDLAKSSVVGVSVE